MLKYVCVSLCCWKFPQQKIQFFEVSRYSAKLSLPITSTLRKNSIQEMVDLFENKEKLFSGPHFIPLEEIETKSYTLRHTTVMAKKGEIATKMILLIFTGHSY